MCSKIWEKEMGADSYSRKRRYYKGWLFLLLLAVGLFLAKGGTRAQIGSDEKDQLPLVAEWDNFYDVASLDKEHAWVVGYWGKILYTADGGKSWQIQKSGTDDPLFSVFFTDLQHGVITGREGTILYTEDGGKSWKRSQSPKNVQLISVTFADDQNVWAVGDFGTIIHSPDRGKTWEDRSLEEDTILNEVYFFDSQNGWIVGEFGKILHSADGGNTWEVQANLVGVYKDPEIGIFGVYLYDVKFADLNYGWAVGLAGSILSTEDGGKTWTSVSTENSQTIFSTAIGKEGMFAVGTAGTVINSNMNSQHSWKIRKDVEVYSWLRSITFSIPDYGWMVGGRGNIFRTTDGGKSWKLVVTPAQ